jgi:PAS domain S-box-containing protein
MAKIIVNEQGDILLVNKMAETLFGYDRKDLLNMKIESLIPAQFRGHHTELRKGFHHNLKTRPMGVGRELCALRKDGVQIPVEIALTSIETEQGSCVLTTIVDITQRKKAEEILKRDKESLEKLVDERSKELIKTQKDLKQFSRLADIGTLAASVAHELRNPLGVIQLAAYNLRKQNNALNGNKHLENIEKKVWEGDQIINNLLTYSRIKIPNYENVPLIHIIDECVVSVRERFAQNGITVEKEYTDGLKVIEADPNQIREICLNILNNACQACLEHGGQVQLKLAREGDMAKICVADTGVGISEEDMEKIFEPFFTRKSKGTGLGLTICNELVNLHGGTIEVNSRLGEGTTFCIFIPIDRKNYAQPATH